MNSTGLYKVYELVGTFSFLIWQELTVNIPTIHKWKAKFQLIMISSEFFSLFIEIVTQSRISLKDNSWKFLSDTCTNISDFHMTVRKDKVYIYYVILFHIFGAIFISEFHPIQILMPFSFPSSVLIMFSLIKC